MLRTEGTEIVNKALTSGYEYAVLVFSSAPRVLANNSEFQGQQCLGELGAKMLKRIRS